MEKPCLNCGKLMTKKYSESKNRFENKKFCSTACSRVWMKKMGLGWFAKEQ